jgi:hypothetical protein
MAFVLKSAYIGYTTAASTAGYNNLSPHVRAVSIAAEADAPENTAMGDDWRTYTGGGLLNWNMSVEFIQSFTTAATVAPGGLPLWATLGTTSVSWRVRPTTEIVSVTNPEFRGVGLGLSMGPVAGSVGELAMMSYEIQGVDTLTRGTTSNTG